MCKHPTVNMLVQIIHAPDAMLHCKTTAVFSDSVVPSMGATTADPRRIRPRSETLLGDKTMTTNHFAAIAADTFSIDPMALALAARRNRDAYIADMLSRGTQALTARLGGWLRRRRTFAELQQLDSRLMADIGLDRAAFAAGIIRRMNDDRTQAIVGQTFAPVASPMPRHAAEAHLATAVTPAAANTTIDSRRAA